MSTHRSRRRRSVAPLLAGIGATASVAAGGAAPAPAAPGAVTPIPFAAADATNTLDLVTQPDGGVALAWTHAVSRAGVGFALRPPTASFAEGIVQDLTGSNSSVIGLASPGGGAPLRLLRSDDTSIVTHRLGANGLDGGTSRNVGLIGSRAHTSCADGGTALISETPTSGAPAFRRLRLDRTSAAGGSSNLSGWSGSHDDDDFPRLDLTCAGGDLSVAVNRDTDLGADAIRVASVFTFEGFAPTERIRITEPTGGSLDQSRVARLPDGTVVLVQEFENADGTYGVALATNASGEPMTTTATAISGADLRDVAVDGDGRLLVLYDAHAPSSTDNDDDGIATVLTLAPGASTDVRTPVSATADDIPRRFQTGHPDGRVRLMTPLPDDSVDVSGLPGVPGQTADVPIKVRPTPTPGVFPGEFRATYLPSGDLVAVWQDGGNPDGRIVEGGIDTGVPPTLGTLSVPGAVVAGEPVVLEMDPSDPMGLASTGWTVEGTERTGSRVTASFATAGTRTVTAAAVDRAGNRTETTRTIRVLPADAVAPAPAAPPAPPTVVAVPGPTAVVPTAAKPAAARDRRAPRITGLSQRPSRLSPRATVLRMRVRADEAASLDLELIGRVRRGKDRGTLIVSTARVARLTRNRFRTVPLRLRPGLVRLVEKRRLQVRAIATDGAGNRRTRTVTVRRRR